MVVPRCGDRPTVTYTIRPISNGYTAYEGIELKTKDEGPDEQYQQHESSILPQTDKWGRHGNHRKLSDTRFDFVIQHVKMFPQYKSHYSKGKILTKVTSEVFHLWLKCNTLIYQNIQNSPI